jgi:murein DD-endopeptidase MepM/ murein hydrolase activator NlpD
MPALPGIPVSAGYRLHVPFAPWEEFEVPPLPVVRITEEFLPRDINHVSSTDPELFAESDVLRIDLMRLQMGAYSFPLPGAKMISPYGGRRKTHTGADLKTYAGDTVRAVFDGIVRMAKSYSAYGNVIVIRHFNGLETVYSHNSRHLTTQGAHVKAGQPIALTGRTGRATTEHLHFETRINGRPFDPSLLFNWETQALQEKVLVCTKNKNRIDVSTINPLLLRATH